MYVHTNAQYFWRALTFRLSSATKRTVYMTIKTLKLKTPNWRLLAALTHRHNPAATCPTCSARCSATLDWRPPNRRRRKPHGTRISRYRERYERDDRSPVQEATDIP